MVAVVVGMVGSDDETIASKATRFLSSFGQSSLQAAGSLLLNSPTAASTTHLEHLRKIMNKSDIMRYRVYEVGTLAIINPRYILDVTFSNVPNLNPKSGPFGFAVLSGMLISTLQGKGRGYS